jgi:hypothetical protein
MGVIRTLRFRRLGPEGFIISGIITGAEKQINFRLFPFQEERNLVQVYQVNQLSFLSNR